MAEINVAQKGGRRRAAAPCIDLTPMVDLGFLLITFFMFTTSLAQSKTLALNMPDSAPVNNPMAYPEEATITLMPAAGHRVYYYEGALKDASQMRSCTVAETRPILLAKQSTLSRLPASYSKQAHLLHVLIKPDKGSKYADLVNLLDEMLILKTDYYTIVDITPEEAQMIGAK